MTTLVVMVMSSMDCLKTCCDYTGCHGDALTGPTVTTLVVVMMSSLDCLKTCCDYNACHGDVLTGLSENLL